VPYAAPMDAQVAAAVTALVAVALIAAMDWIRTPLNRNIEAMGVRERLPGTLIHVAVGVGVAVVNLLRWRWPILVGAVWFTVVLAVAILNWWVPYFLGRYPAEITPEVYGRDYARNVTVLPRIAGRQVVPDVQHTLIHLGVLAACVASWVSFASL
jgi:hypothetical protein